MKSVVALALAFGVLQAASVTYDDPRGRFHFTYPDSFGQTSVGTDDGFEDRVAALRFTKLSMDLGGEATLTKGFPLVDIQAVGGLYDHIELGVFPDAARKTIVGLLTPLTATNFCEQLAKERHLDPVHPGLASLSPAVRTVLPDVDTTRHVAPKIVRCTTVRDAITFDEEVGFKVGGPRMHVYGAVRFLDAPYSTFQMVKAGPAVNLGVLDQITAAVQSWRR